MIHFCFMDSHPNRDTTFERIFHPKMGQRLLILQLILEPPELVYKAKEMPPTGVQVCIDMSIDLYFYCFIYIYNIFIYFLKESLQKLPSHLAKQRLNNQRQCPGAKYPRGSHGARTTAAHQHPLPKPL